MNASVDRAYAQLLRDAHRASRRADEAEDLLQVVLLAAVVAGRADMTVACNRRWLRGALRKRGLFEARSAVRRKARDALAVTEAAPPEEAAPTAAFVQSLPPGLRTTALLALTGHDKAEIRWLLDVSDAALRQRFTQIRKRWRAAEGTGSVGLQGLEGSLAFGRLRKTLLEVVRGDGVRLGSHDPDGHLFVVGSQSGGPRQPKGTPTQE